MTPQEIAALAQIQRRASVEDRAHLVALVEHAWGVPAASAERLVPGGVRADTRLDCEKPIRDEHGKFLGCEPGGGDGSSGGASAGGGSTPKRETAAPHESDSPRVARVKAERAKSRREVTWKSAEEHDEFDHEEITKAKALDEAAKKGHVLIPKVGDGEGGEALHQIAAKREEALSAEGDDLHEHHAKAITALAELRDLNFAGDDPILNVDTDDGELEFDATATTFGSDSRKGDIKSPPPRERTEEDEELEEPEEPVEPQLSDFANEEAGMTAGNYNEVDEDAFKEAKAEYKKEKAAHKKAVAEWKQKREEAKEKVMSKAAEVADIFESTHERQLQAIAKLKLANKNAKAAVKSAFKGADIDQEDLIAPDVKKRQTAAEKYYDSDGEGSDEESEKHDKAQQEYDAAYDAAETLSSELNEAKDNALDDNEFVSKLEQLQNTARATKQRAAQLRKALKQKPKVYKKAAVDEDEEDDTDEE